VFSQEEGRSWHTSVCTMCAHTSKEEGRCSHTSEEEGRCWQTSVYNRVEMCVRIPLRRRAGVLSGGGQVVAYLCMYYVCPHVSRDVSSYLSMCVLICLGMCPHTSLCVSSFV
jgi:hypothetical protein